MERGGLFRHFCVFKVITTARAHKSGVIFHIFPRAFKQKKKKLRLNNQRWLKLHWGGGGGGGGPSLKWTVKDSEVHVSFFSMLFP